MKLDLLTNATVVDDAIKFISQKSKGTLKSSGEDEKEESNEPDYEPMEINHTSRNINEVF
jgi:hypothetical protein